MRELPEGGGVRIDSDREWRALDPTLECTVGERRGQPAFSLNRCGKEQLQKRGWHWERQKGTGQERTFETGEHGKFASRKGKSVCLWTGGRS